jgi:putative membrane protein
MSPRELVLAAMSAAFLAGCGDRDPAPPPPPATSEAPNATGQAPSVTGQRGPQDKTPGGGQTTTAPGQDQAMSGTPQAPIQNPQAAAPGHAQSAAQAAAVGAGTAALPADASAVPAGSADDPRIFLIAAASSGMLEVAASKMAREKATRADVKAFAERMIAEHAKAHDELKALAATRNITLTESMQAAHQADLDTLSRLEGSAFDQAYAQRIGVQAHMTTVALFQQAAAKMPDAELKAYIDRTLPTLREHLDAAQRLNQSVAARS